MLYNSERQNDQNKVEHIVITFKSVGWVLILEGKVCCRGAPGGAVKQLPLIAPAKTNTADEGGRADSRPTIHYTSLYCQRSFASPEHEYKKHIPLHALLAGAQGGDAPCYDLSGKIQSHVKNRSAVASMVAKKRSAMLSAPTMQHAAISVWLEKQACKDWPLVLLN